MPKRLHATAKPEIRPGGWCIIGEQRGPATFPANGSGAIVIEDYQQPDVKLDYFGGTPGTYVGFDRFGRVIRQEWYDYGASETRDRHDYTYDANSNRISRDNTLTAGKDEKYTYDGLNRLTGYDRGTLSGGDITNKVRNEAWTLSQTGNWGEFKIDADGDGSYDDAGDLDQNRAHNDVNEITGITEDFGPAWADPAYDAAGNMTTAPKPTDMTAAYTCTYDAWNRLCEVSSGETTVGRYEYDGLNRRIKKHIDTQAPGSPDGVDTYRHFFYDSSWRIVETRSTTSDPDTQPETLQPECQYVWSLRYIDAPILRDGNTDADDLCDDQRLYYLADANMNVTAVADTGGDALERYAYDPYGNVTVLDADWSDDADGVSDYDNSILYCGYYRDAETGLYHVRNRYLLSNLGRWLTRDPIGYADGMSLYEYVRSRPITAIDPVGFKTYTKDIKIKNSNGGGEHFDVTYEYTYECDEETGKITFGGPEISSRQYYRGEGADTIDWATTSDRLWPVPAGVDHILRDEGPVVEDTPLGGDGGIEKKVTWTIIWDAYSWIGIPYLGATGGKIREISRKEIVLNFKCKKCKQRNHVQPDDTYNQSDTDNQLDTDIQPAIEKRHYPETQPDTYNWDTDNQPAPGNDGTYLIKRGDNLSTIMKNHGYNYYNKSDRLQWFRANPGLEDRPDDIPEGGTLVIPK